MEAYLNIHTAEEIREGLARVFAEVSDLVAPLTDEAYREKTSEKWSVAENLDHLNLSARPVAKGLRLPKLAFRAFGLAKKDSRSFGDLAAAYRELLAQGGRAGGAYVPQGTDALPDAADQLAEWKKTLSYFHKNLEKWSESDLDKYRMPHPLLGKLTAREMLFFTIYHTWHHVQACKMLNA